jgi:nitroimidazol reductase NimA-like FMN-containing flavoprotein (pyridoxamine 5'-phosphate oxidase superfamily)
MRMMTYLIDLAPQDCVALLASSTVGRLGVVVDGRPEIFPVSHAYDDVTGCVLFPTNDRTKLRGALGWPYVAFEVDGMDPDGEGGWSVLVVGRAEVLADEQAISRASQARHVAWRGGESVTWLKIVPSKVTGRRICASDHGVSIVWP